MPPMDLGIKGLVGDIEGEGCHQVSSVSKCSWTGLRPQLRDTDLLPLELSFNFMTALEYYLRDWWQPTSPEKLLEIPTSQMQLHVFPRPSLNQHQCSFTSLYGFQQQLNSPHDTNPLDHCLLCRVRSKKIKASKERTHQTNTSCSAPQVCREAVEVTVAPHGTVKDSSEAPEVAFQCLIC